VADKKVVNRLALFSAIGDLGANLKGVRLSERGLNDKDPDVRAAAATSLGEMKSRAAIPKLRIALADKAPQVSFAAAKSLWQLGDRTGRRVLLDILEGEKPASDSFIQSGKRDMQRKLQDPKGLAMLGAEKGAGALLGPFSMGIPLMKELRGEGAGSPRAVSATMLAARPDKETIEALKRALSDRDWTVRAAAARAIGKLGRPDLSAFLTTALEDSKPSVRFAAAVSVIRLESAKSTTRYAQVR
jgi:HEAT repeat protein